MTGLAISSWRPPLRLWMLVLTLMASGWIPTARAQEQAQFVGATACSGCHQTQAALWKSSHHAQAMQPASPDTVLGAFNNTDHSRNGLTTSFSRSGDNYTVR